MSSPAAHEKCGRAEAAAGSGAQGSTASPAGEAGGGPAVAAGVWCVMGTFSSLNGLVHLVSFGGVHGEGRCEFTG